MIKLLNHILKKTALTLSESICKLMYASLTVMIGLFLSFCQNLRNFIVNCTNKIKGSIRVISELVKMGRRKNGRKKKQGGNEPELTVPDEDKQAQSIQEMDRTNDDEDKPGQNSQEMDRTNDASLPVQTEQEERLVRE